MHTFTIQICFLADLDLVLTLHPTDGPAIPFRVADDRVRRALHRAGIQVHDVADPDLCWNGVHPDEVEEDLEPSVHRHWIAWCFQTDSSGEQIMDALKPVTGERRGSIEALIDAIALYEGSTLVGATATCAEALCLAGAEDYGTNPF